ncbi:MAG: site-2 protease family protein [Candidatus Saliniplasma sp.]
MLGISSGIITALIIIIVFFIFFTILQKLGVLERFGLEMTIPFLIWQTQRGRKFIDGTAQKRKKFWKTYGSLGIIVASICMVLIMILVIWSAMLASQIPSDQAPSPDMVLAIPGVNPLIPIWYGIAGLAISIIIHEFSHGILARVADVKINSLGLAFLVVPLGAFVEPDEDEMNSLSKLKRSRIYAAGPTTNVILAIILVIIFSTIFMGSISPKQDGVIIKQISSESPLYNLDVEGGEEIINIDGVDIGGIDEYRALEIEPGSDVDVTIFDGTNERTHEVKSGLMVTGLGDGYPAEEAGLKTGDILLKMEDETIRNHEDFFDYMDGTEAGETYDITYYRKEEGNHTSEITLVDKYEAYEEMYPTENKEDFKGAGYAGASVNYMGISVWDSDFLPAMLSRPFEGAETFSEYVGSGMTYLALPFLGLSPVPENIANLYTVNGPVSILPTSGFWIISNLIYWVFWLNLMVGLFNALPAVPLDGGHIFKDGIRKLAEVFNIEEKKKETITSSVSYILGFTILFLLIWQLVGPRV